MVFCGIVFSILNMTTMNIVMISRRERAISHAVNTTTPLSSMTHGKGQLNCCLAWAFLQLINCLFLPLFHSIYCFLFLNKISSVHKATRLVLLHVCNQWQSYRGCSCAIHRPPSPLSTILDPATVPLFRAVCGLLRESRPLALDPWVSAAF